MKVIFGDQMVINLMVVYVVQNVYIGLIKK